MSKYICKYCNQEFKGKGSIGGHTTFCEKNPNNKITKENFTNRVEKVHNKKKEERILEYNLNPTLCKNCNNSLPYEFKKNKRKFCNHSCSAQYNNKTRIVKERKFSEQGLENIRKSNKIIYERKYNLLPGEKRFTTKKEKRIYNKKIIDGIKVIDIVEKPEYYKKINIKIVNCSICSKLFVKKGYSSKKTCSKECRTQASVGIRTYQNGSRKPEWYFNKWENKKVLLDSSWERKVAEKLDEYNIKWARPNPIEWVDKNNLSHLYYPDFYLNDFDIYLDPKNPYCMEKDKEKMEMVCNKIFVQYGMLKDIIKGINILK